MKKPGMILVLMTLVVPNSVSQIIVSDDNNVGIGTSSPESKLSIAGEGDSTTTLYLKDDIPGNNKKAAYFYKSNCYSDFTTALQAKTIIDGGSKLGAGNFTAYASSPMSSYRTFGVRGVTGNATSAYNYGLFDYLIGSNNGTAVFELII